MTYHDNHTKIHNVWYDLSEFNHPGGPVALQLASMRDATALFEIHHPFSDKVMLKKVLEKYRLTDEEVVKRGVKLDEKEVNEEEFIWEEKDEFREELVEEVRGYFQGIADEKGIKLLDAIKSPAWHTAIMVFLILCIVALYPFYLMGYWLTLVLLPVIVFSVTARLMHDGSHFAASRNWKVNQVVTHAAPWLASSSSWFIQHVIGHHAHTNIPDRDPDMYHGIENWRYVPSVKWEKHYINQHKLFPLIWSGSSITIAFLVDLFDPEYYNGVTQVGKRTTQYYYFFFWLRMTINLCLFGAPIVTIGIIKGTIFFLTTWIMLSVLFMAFSQVSHLDEVCGTARHTNFWKHTLAVSIDYYCDSMFWNYFSVGLNCQAIHHSFPTINPCHYPALYPIFKSVAEKHGVEYQLKASYWAAFRDYWNVLKLYSTPDNAEELALIASHQKPSLVADL